MATHIASPHKRTKIKLIFEEYEWLEQKEYTQIILRSPHKRTNFKFIFEEWLEKKNKLKLFLKGTKVL